MSAAAPNTVRDLFEALCDLPPSAWRARLAELDADPQVAARVLELLEAQTVSLQRAVAPLGELMASLPETELAVGDRLGVWRLVERLGAGGMGTVFVAERDDRLYRHRVAIKLLRGIASPGASERLAGERQILADLQHPNIARLYDGGTTPAGQPYLVMEYIAGRTLDAWRGQAARPLDACVDMMLRICRAVQAAHQRLVVHCDLKPSNILVREDGEPVLLDFGIARMQDDASGAGGYGTPGYASPEQRAGHRPQAASDVYSLGVILVELLAGRRAHPDGNAVPAPSALAEDGRLKRRLRGDLDAICARACRPEAEDRYPSVEAFAADLERHRRHLPVRARPATPGYRMRRSLRRRWRGAAAAAVFVALVGTFVWRLDAERARAEAEARVAQEVSDFLVAAFEAADPRGRGAAGAERIEARDVLDQASIRIGRELVSDPLLRARLLDTLAEAYNNLGETERANGLFREAAEVARDGSREARLIAAEALSHQAVMLANAGHGADAVAAAEHADRLRGDRDPALHAESLNTLGLAYQSSGDLDAAQAALESALALRREVIGPRGLETSATLHNLGQLASRRGRLAEAEALYREALAIKRAAAGTLSYEYANGLRGLGVTLARQGRYAEAGDILRECLTITERVHGADSSRAADLHGELASVLQDEGDYDASEQEYRAAIAMDAAVNGADTLDQAVFANNLASLLEMRGDLAGAEEGYRRSLELRRRHLEETAPAVVRARANLARLLMRTARVAQARPMLEAALDDWLALHGEDNPDTVITRISLAELELLDAHPDAAERALAGLAASPVLAESAPLRLRRDVVAAQLASARDGATADAVAQWRAVVATAAQDLGEMHVRTAQWRLDYARALLAAARIDDARMEIERAAPVLRRLLLPQTPALADLQGLERRTGLASG
ncbi:tetratricopeptide repeat protein [Coralloluteibacterium stylophorae]|uniref:Serine/threonine protein kinase n=2 Tax=Coralloluteibacterium stylophorae TaxID=1776034 RepID=A0AAP2G0Y1_9GAMM|nr:tetratricopeptide repeat protein [Coralloluteibacterium stylophorae]MBS7457846.1 serine/threonine protein kinase [Coralloluteibacterium stylophorae]